MLTKKNRKFVWGGLHPLSYHPFVFNFIPDLENKVIVDCGCGKGIWGYLIRTMRPLGKRGKLIGIDIKDTYISFCKEHKVYDELTKGDIRSLPFEDKSVDFLICSEVIEHLPKNKGEQFLEEIDRVFRNGGRAIITTPNVDIETVMPGHDAHRSKWGVKDFKRKGYQVYGMGIKISPGFGKWYTPFVLGLGYVFTPISYIYPKFAGFLIAIKDFKDD